MRIVVVSGYGIKGSFTGSDGTYHELVFGRMPYLAERLKAHSRPNQIVVNQEAASRVRERYRLENLGLMNLNGFSEDVSAWSVGV